MITTGQWLAHFRAARARIEPELGMAVKTVAELGAEVAKAYLGHLAPSLSMGSPVPVHFPAWDPLAPSTIEDKAGLGFGPPDYAPLYRTGEMQESISGSAVGLTGVVGSTDPVAVFHEFGTSKMPPRPFLARAVADVTPVLNVELGRVAVSILKPE
jgi:HK97 gp10 family phage protein